MIAEGEKIKRQFDKAMRDLCPQNVLVSPVRLVQECDRMLLEAEKQLEDKLKVFYSLPARQRQDKIKEFMQPLIEARNHKVVCNNELMEDAKLKVIATPILGYIGWTFATHYV